MSTSPPGENRPAPRPDLLSVDVEDYFHLLIDRPETWDTYSVHLDAGVSRILDRFDELGIRATFFVLADAARRDPGAVRRISGRNHEIASHGHDHQLVYRQGEAAFREDARRSRALLEDLTGRPVRGFRASSFSVTPETPWFWRILEEEGYDYSSSLHPVRNFLYGKTVDAPLDPHLAAGTELVEVPVVPGRFLGQAIPFSGGFYLRCFPGWLLEWTARRVRSHGHAVHWYVHSWEVDLEQPRLPLAPHWRFFRYFRLHATEPVLQRLLADRPISTVGEAVDRFRAERTPHA